RNREDPERQHCIAPAWAYEKQYRLRGYHDQDRARRHQDQGVEKQHSSKARGQLLSMVLQSGERWKQYAANDRGEDRGGKLDQIVRPRVIAKRRSTESVSDHYVVPIGGEDASNLADGLPRTERHQFAEPITVDAQGNSWRARDD